jgi:hypothetical protein
MSQSNEHNTVTHRPIARKRLGKHIPAGANARNNRIFIARQRISKHASLTINAVFSMLSEARPLLCNGTVNTLQQQRLCFLRGPCRGFVLKTTGATMQLRVRLLSVNQRATEAEESPLFRFVPKKRLVITLQRNSHC